MINKEFGPVEFVTFYDSVYSETKKFAQVRQMITTVTINEEDVLMPKQSREVIEEKYRYTFTAFPADGTEQQFKALIKQLDARIIRIRGCELHSVLSKNQIGYYNSSDPERADALETSWANNLISASPEGEPWLYGSLQLEQYGRNVLVTDPDQFKDVDFRKADHARALEEVAKREAEERNLIDEDAPALTEVDQVDDEIVVA